MFTQMRFNLKLIGTIMFSVVFLVGLFFINMKTVFALTSIASVTISPSISYSLENSDYTLSIQRDNSSTSTGGIGSIEIIVPTEYGIPTIKSLTITCNPSCTKNWINDGFSSGKIKIHSNGTENKLKNSDKIDITITSVSPANPKSNPGYEWTTNIFTNLYYDGTLYTISTQPTVDIVTPLSSNKDITSFTFPGLGSGIITGNDILIDVPFGTNVTTLTPTITTTGVSISPNSLLTQNFTNPVTYTVTAEDSSTQNYNVIVTIASDDPVASVFNTVHDTLSGENIDSNLNTVTSSNYTAFSGLYFEKSIDGVKMGRITFDSALDLSSPDTKTFLESLEAKLDMSQAGLIGLDFSDTLINPSFKGINATIKFYNLDKLGFTATSTVDEINSKLIALDDNGNIIDKSTLIPNGATPLYIGTCEVFGPCFTFTIPVNHFTKYKIGENTTLTTVTTSHSSGNYITPQIIPVTNIKLVGCAPGSGDLYDVNTGIRCTIDTSKKIQDDFTSNEKIEILNKNPIITSSENTPKKLIAVSEITPVVNNIKEYIPLESDEESHLSGREKISNSLYASVAKVGSIFHGPIIILIIIIVFLGGGYGIYSILTKNNNKTLVNKDIK